MTDEQLTSIETSAHLDGGICKDDAMALIADYRRLRELERACRAMREFEPLTIVWQHNYDTIGRLLEGE